MTMVQIKGILTENGKIEIEIPEGWQPGEVHVEITIDSVWSDDEIDELTKSNVKPASEITTGGWEDLDIQDSVEWVNENRQKRRGRFTW
ncbi:MAG: hypothetical protein WBC91_13005 [Phototrophicaceae bacterium]